MKQKNMPTFLLLSKALEETARKLHPSEAHGIITGMLCQPIPQEIKWEDLIGEKTTPKTQKMLEQLLETTAEHLQSYLFDFELLMLEDTEALTERAEGLTLWCQGFITGLSLAHVPITGREQSDVTEAINDIVEIAKMNYEDVIASEEDEVAYIELVEYVRMGAILIYQSYHDVVDAHKKQIQSSHYH